MNNIELYKKYIVYSHGKRNNSFSQLVVSKRAILTNNRLCCSFFCVRRDLDDEKRFFIRFYFKSV